MQLCHWQKNSLRLNDETIATLIKDKEKLSRDLRQSERSKIVIEGQKLDLQNQLNELKIISKKVEEIEAQSLAKLKELTEREKASRGSSSRGETRTRKSYQNLESSIDDEVEVLVRHIKTVAKEQQEVSNTQTTKLEDERNELRSQLELKNKKLEATEKRLDKVKKNLQDSQSEISRLKGQLECGTRSLIEINRKSAKLEQEVRDLTNQLNENLSNFASEKVELKRQVEELGEGKETIAKELQLAKTEIETLKKQMIRIRRYCSTMVTRKDKSEIEKARLSKRNSLLMRDIKSLKVKLNTQSSLARRKIAKLKDLFDQGKYFALYNMKL